MLELAAGSMMALAMVADNAAPVVQARPLSDAIAACVAAGRGGSAPVGIDNPSFAAAAASSAAAARIAARVAVGIAARVAAALDVSRRHLTSRSGG